MIEDFLRQVSDETTPLHRDIQAAVTNVRSVMGLLGDERIEANLRAISSFRSLIDRDFDQDVIVARAAYHNAQRQGETR